MISRFAPQTDAPDRIDGRDRLRWVLAACLVGAFSCSSSLAQEKMPDRQAKLSPPLPEIPASFWEQYGAWIIAAVVGVILLATLLILLLRKQPGPIVEPIEVRTRRELEVLRRQGSDPQTVSRITRCLRRYLGVAFGLPDEEVTTSELIRAFESNASLAIDLKGRLVVFFRDADQFKFAPLPTPRTDFPQQAFELFEDCERRRTESPIAPVQPPVSP